MRLTTTEIRMDNAELFQALFDVLGPQDKNRLRQLLENTYSDAFEDGYSEVIAGWETGQEQSVDCYWQQYRDDMEAMNGDVEDPIEDLDLMESVPSQLADELDSPAPWKETKGLGWNDPEAWK